MKNKRANKAVSEIIGTIMLLSIAVTLFSTVYVFVLNEALDPTEHSPATNIIGTTEGKDLIFTHPGENFPGLICWLKNAKTIVAFKNAITNPKTVMKMLTTNSQFRQN